MSPWVRDALKEAEVEDFNFGALDMLTEVGVAFHLGESPRETAQRRWWDILMMRTAISRDMRRHG